MLIVVTMVKELNERLQQNINNMWRRARNKYKKRSPMCWGTAFRLPFGSSMMEKRHDRWHSKDGQKERKVPTWFKNEQREKMGKAPIDKSEEN